MNHWSARYECLPESQDFVLSEESVALAWVEIAGLEKITTETSILRMRDKWLTGDGH